MCQTARGGQLVDERFIQVMIQSVAFGKHVEYCHFVWAGVCYGQRMHYNYRLGR